MCQCLQGSGLCYYYYNAIDRHLDYWISCVIATEPPYPSPFLFLLLPSWLSSLVLFFIAVCCYMLSCSPSPVLFQSTLTCSLISCLLLISLVSGCAFAFIALELNWIMCIIRHCKHNHAALTKSPR